MESLEREPLAIAPSLHSVYILYSTPLDIESFDYTL